MYQKVHHINETTPSLLLLPPPPKKKCPWSFYPLTVVKSQAGQLICQQQIKMMKVRSWHSQIYMRFTCPCENYLLIGQQEHSVQYPTNQIWCKKNSLMCKFVMLSFLCLFMIGLANVYFRIYTNQTLG